MAGSVKRIKISSLNTKEFQETYDKIAKTVLNFEEIEEDEYKNLIFNYIACVATEYNFEHIFCEIDYNSSFEVCVILKDKVLKYSSDLLIKPKNIQDFISMVQVIEQQISFFNKYRNTNSIFNKISNKNGKIIDTDLLDFYKYLNLKIGLSEDQSPVIALGIFDLCERQYDIRITTYKKTSKFINKMIDFYKEEYPNERFDLLKEQSSFLDKLPFWRKKLLSKPERMRKSIKIAMDENFEYFKMNEVIETAKKNFRPERRELLKNYVKEQYYNLCFNCLRGNTEIESIGWGLLAKGLENRSFYNQELADILYDKCFKIGHYPACLIILNAVDYPVNLDKMQELIKAKDNEFFKIAYDKYLTNFDDEFKESFYQKFSKKECEPEKER
ncbi:MAG: hypothetical protein PHR96_03435 [Clostridia bacterium]|nr:hypothetical protein [Clostridia bacterium]